MIRKYRLSIKMRYVLEGYSFLSLWIIGFFVFMALPLGRSVYYAFQDLQVNKDRLKATYVGFTHFRYAFSVDVEFAPILMQTMSNMIVHVPLILIFAMLCALLLHRPFKGRLVFRGVFFLPVIIATGSVLQKLLDQGAATLPIFRRFDLALLLADYIPGELLIPLIKMLDSLMLIMWGAGVQILIFIAGLQTIPASLYEAAKCDGATVWESFWKITFPMMMPMILVGTLFSIVDSFTKVNNEMMLYIYKMVFAKINYGYAAAIGWIYFILIFIVICIVLYLFRNTSAFAQERR